MTTQKHSDACITAAVNGTCEHEAAGFNAGYRKAFAEQAAKLERDAADCPKCGGSSCSHVWEMETESDPRDARIAELEAALREVRAAFFEDARSGATVINGKLEHVDDDLHPWIAGGRAPKVIALIDHALNPAIEVNLGDKETK